MASSLTAQQLEPLLRTQPSVHLIDVRTPAEFDRCHVRGARNLPLDRLDPPALLAELAGTTPVYVICQSGMRSRQACEALDRAGFREVYNIEGGTVACERNGIPVHRARRQISIERQVRIGAGSLVLLGFALAWAFDPRFLGLSLFVGAGLVFAGVTDICAMGILLEKMPWNRSRPSSS